MGALERYASTATAAAPIEPTVLALVALAVGPRFNRAQNRRSTVSPIMIVLSAMCPWTAIDGGTWWDSAGLSTMLD